MNSLSRVCSDYCGALPNNAARAVLESGIYTFAVVIFMTHNKDAAIIAGVFNASVAVIHALATPIFKYLFGSNTVGTIKSAVTVICSFVLADNLTSHYLRIASRIDQLGALLFMTYFVPAVARLMREREPFVTYNLNEATAIAPLPVALFRNI